MASPAGSSETLVVDRDSIGGTCDDARAPSSVSVSAPWCSLDRALAAAPSGAVVSVRAGDYGPAAVKRRQRDAYVTITPYAEEIVTVAGLKIEDSSRIRLLGLRFTARLEVGVGSEHIDIAENDLTGQGISVRVARDVLIRGNRIHDLTYAGAGAGAGYGIWLNGSWSDPARTPGIYDVAIRGNDFDRIPADAIQMGSVHNVLVDRNDFTRITPFLDPTEHSDAIQMYGPATKVTIRRNVFHETVRGVIAKGFAYPGLVIENNVMVRLAGTALNIYNAPGARIVNNTIWDVPLALRLRDLPQVTERMRDAVVANNILQSFAFSSSHIAVEDHNIIGTRILGQTYGDHDLFERPAFLNAPAVDYRLRKSDPGVDAAMADLAPARDRRALPRVDLDSVPDRGTGDPPFTDIGAHEVQLLP